MGASNPPGQLGLARRVLFLAYAEASIVRKTRTEVRCGTGRAYERYRKLRR